MIGHAETDTPLKKARAAARRRRWLSGGLGGSIPVKGHTAALVGALGRPLWPGASVTIDSRQLQEGLHVDSEWKLSVHNKGLAAAPRKE